MYLRSDVDCHLLQPDVDSQDNSGSTQLHHSAYHGQYSSCNDLISRGANVNLLDQNGCTPLRLASRTGHGDISRLLCQAGAKVHFQDYKGRTAIEIAQKKKYHDIVALLTEFSEAQFNEPEPKTYKG